MCVSVCVWFSGVVGKLVAATDDSKAAGIRAVIGDVHALIPLLRTGGRY